MPVRSPCTGNCLESNGICRGCGRTAQETDEWPTATDERRMEILENIESRKLDNDKP